MVISCNKFIVTSALAGFTLLGILSATPAHTGKSKYKNLRVLSKNIGDDEMDYVMETFNVNLGSNCLFCHPGQMNGTEYSFDFATDRLQNKRVARDMLRMTMKLNKKYFNVQMDGLMITKGVIWCKTCHDGSPVPILPSSKKK